MAKAVLEAFLGLNTRQFQRALARARAEANDFAKRGLQALGVATVAAGAALLAGTKRILGVGGALSDVRARTSVTVKELMILQDALKANGVEASKAGPALNKMQRSLVDAAKGAKEPTEALRLLGVEVGDITSRSTIDQFRTLAERINAVEDPAQRTAAAMAIFGKSGAELLTAFADTGAIDDAVAKLGQMPAVMERFANAFDRADDIITALPAKADQFFTGFASEIVGSILGPLERLNKMDFTELGQNLGRAVRPWIEAITSGRIWELVGLQAARAGALLGETIIEGVTEVGDVLSSGFLAAFSVAKSAVVDFGRTLWGVLRSAFDVAADHFATTFKRVAMEFGADLLDAIALVPGPIGQKARIDSALLRSAGAATPNPMSLSEAFARNGGQGESAKSFADEFARIMSRTKNDFLPKDRLSDSLQRDIDALMSNLASLGDAHTAAAAAMSNVATAASGSNGSGGATAALLALASAANSVGDFFSKRLGFSLGDAASGARGGGLITAAARRVSRLEGEQQRFSDRALREEAQAQAYLESGDMAFARRYKGFARNSQNEADKRGRAIGEVLGKLPAAKDPMSAVIDGIKNAAKEMRDLTEQLKTIGTKLGVYA